MPEDKFNPFKIPEKDKSGHIQTPKESEQKWKEGGRDNKDKLQQDKLQQDKLRKDKDKY